MDVQGTVEHVRNRTGRPIPPARSDNYLDQASVSTQTIPPPEESVWVVIRIAVMMVVALALIGGGIVYGAVRLGWIERKPPVAAAPVLLPTTLTPTPTQLHPTKTPNPNVQTTTVVSTPTIEPTPAPIPESAPTATPTTAVVVPVPTEQEIVVNAFAECDRQYSGADQQFRAQAANHAIEEGRQTVADVRRLVDEYCNGAVPDLVAVIDVEHPTLAKPTATSAPTPTPTSRPTPTKAPTLRPTPTLIVSMTGGNGRFNQAQMEAAIQQQINVYREEQGRAAFNWDDDLAQLARAHSKDMARNNYYSHTNRAGDDPSARARKAGYDCRNPRSIGVAENIHVLYGHTSMLYGRPYEWETQERMIQRFVADWINSPGHRRNVLDPRYGRTGIGIAFGNYNGIQGAIFATQKFC